MSEGFLNAFWIILTGALVAGSCGLLGTFLVLRRMSLLGDAISHAVLPGIAIAFLLSGSRAVLPMFLGAAAFGLLTTLLIETMHRRLRVQEDAAIGIAFTALFAVGVILISAWAGNVDLDQECVLYGEIAYTPWDVFIVKGTDMGPRPVWILGFVFLLNLLLISLLFKELKLSSFDPALAAALGFNAALLHYILMGAVSLTTVASFESVGAILVVAMFIVPGASAYLWSDRLKTILVLAVVFGICSSIGGYFLALWFDSSIAGAMTAAAGGIFLGSALFSPSQGALGRLWHRLALSVKVAEDHILLALVRRAEKEDTEALERSTLIDATGQPRWASNIAMKQLRRAEKVYRDNGSIRLTREGAAAAVALLKNHRSWEAFLLNLGLPQDHLHGPADTIEHFIDEKLGERLRGELGESNG